MSGHNTGAADLEARRRQRAERQRRNGSDAGRRGESNGNPNQATLLLKLALDRFRPVRSTDEHAYAVPRNGPNIARPLKGRHLAVMPLLSKIYAETNGSVPSRSALIDALETFAGHIDGQHAEEVHLRVARHGNNG